ncbi:hypothetical protein PENSTE_c001G03022 [Penicillium steckii]|uniref:Uncharacterized protein n=1 Tax=Penicillium steckii TaxID=303698 RepID=A0A1V6U0W7_9EURO|nr:hypothetical protein PENSTE_c001G03022 [Penicillium steckii]
MGEIDHRALKQVPYKLIVMAKQYYQVLIFLIMVVLAYAFCSLTYTRWKMRRYAAAEARQKEEEAELFPMLTKDDIPFGARALERGIQIEGIWISNHNTPIQTPHPPGTPLRSRAPSPAARVFLLPSPSPTLVSSIAPATTPPSQSLPVYRSPPPLPAQHRPRTGLNTITGNNYTYEPQRPGGVYSPVMASQIPEPPSKSSRFQRRSEILTSNEKRASFHTRIRRASRIFEKSHPMGVVEHEGMEPGSTSNASGSKSEEPHRASRLARVIRRRSSEEFRRRMSQIFNERIHMTVPAERLQFSPDLWEKRRKKRGSILWPFQSEDSLS